MKSTTMNIFSRYYCFKSLKMSKNTKILPKTHVHFTDIIFRIFQKTTKMLMKINYVLKNAS